jgi:hypothetical protein
MKQEERTQLIREIGNLLQMHQNQNLFDDETISLLKNLLKKCLKLSVL